MSASQNQPLSTVILVTRNGMGHAEPALAHKLFNAYFDLLIANNRLPACVCFYAEGVKLAVEGSPVLDVLRALEEKGVRISVCSTCLNYYGLMDKLAAGKAGDMQGLIYNQWGAGKVITI
jgi:sulfur relay (sulfurtransferase) complex TusBCD TusD component (DsrE family)